MPKYENGSLIALAGLLHDIGRLRQRANYPEDLGKTHGDIGSEWLAEKYGKGLIADAAQVHHGCMSDMWAENLHLIFHEADNCVSGRNSGFKPDVGLDADWLGEVALTNIFSKVHNPGSENASEMPVESFCSMSSLGGWAEPATGRITKEDAVQAYKHLWDGFQNEFEKVKGHENHFNVDVMLHLLEKYTSSAPFISMSIKQRSDKPANSLSADVSLFEHSKFVSAVALCMFYFYRDRYEKRWETETLKTEITGPGASDQPDAPFVLVGGDLSGVQKFIYTISSKGALKALKGRSFFLELLMEDVVERFLEECRLSRANVVFAGGGHFYLLAPNISRTKAAIRKVREETNAYLLSAFQGTLQLFLDGIHFEKPKLNKISQVWADLWTILDNAKERKWDDRLGQLLGSPQMPHGTCLKENCQICGREDEPLLSLSLNAADTMACGYCREQYRLGALLQECFQKGRNPVLYRWSTAPSVDRYVQIGSSYYQPAAGMFGKAKAELLRSASAVYHLNDWDLSRYNHPQSRPLLAGLYFPENKADRDLEGMVKSGFGAKSLAVLRMDVDRLGRIFLRGLNEEERTLPRIASLSRQLSLFFKYHVSGLMENRTDYPEGVRIAERKGDRKLSVVYAGGDDLFLIGQWLDVVEAALDIRKAFARFTANPGMTVSAGLSLGGVHEPVYRLAEQAGHAEGLAKTNGRNSLTLFTSHVFKWEALEAIISLVGVVCGLCAAKEDHLSLPDGSISKGALFRLLELARLHKKLNAWVLPKAAYVFGRANPEGDFAKAWMKLKNYVFSSSADWRRLEISLLITLMLLRKGED